MGGIPWTPHVLELTKEQTNHQLTVNGLIFYQQLLIKAMNKKNYLINLNKYRMENRQ